jgi:hypothetical protein
VNPNEILYNIYSEEIPPKKLRRIALAPKAKVVEQGVVVIPAIQRWRQERVN